MGSGAMNQNEIDLDWCKRVAAEIADELVYAKILAADEVELAAKIAAQEIHLFLVAGDRPEAGSRRYAVQP
jgi:hypothetical protein